MSTPPGFAEAIAAIDGLADRPGLDAGARNLLLNCAELMPGERVLIVHEDPKLGWFDDAAPRAVSETTRRLGATARLLAVGGPDQRVHQDLLREQTKADLVIFFARIGDQDRFAPRTGARTVVSYARTAAELASPFGTTPHRDMLGIKRQIEKHLTRANEIRITCPNGTDMRGACDGSGCGDVTIRRFPMCVPAPVSAARFTGQVALNGYLTPTGSRCYDPPCLAIQGTVFAHVEDGRITGFDGAPAQVRRVEQHYIRIAETFSIDPTRVHSWHAGIHDGCDHEMPATPNPDRWSNSVFGSPRYLHFHTCGDYAPGEICWMVKDPTISVDRLAIWDQGQLCL